MSTMNISLPEALKSFVDEQVTRQSHGSSSEYIRELIRKDRECQRLRELLLDGAASQAAAPANTEYFATLRDHVRKNSGA